MNFAIWEDVAAARKPKDNGTLLAVVGVVPCIDIARFGLLLPGEHGDVGKALIVLMK